MLSFKVMCFSHDDDHWKTPPNGFVSGVGVGGGERGEGGGGHRSKRCVLLCYGLPEVCAVKIVLVARYFRPSWWPGCLDLVVQT